jgi:hypothetical protein
MKNSSAVSYEDRQHKKTGLKKYNDGNKPGNIVTIFIFLGI